MCNTNYTQTPRTLGLKTLGFFVFGKGRMTDRKIKEAEFTRQHTLSPEQFKKLLEDKMSRAIQYYEADRKREIAQG